MNDQPQPLTREQATAQVLPDLVGCTEADLAPWQRGLLGSLPDGSLSLSGVVWRGVSDAAARDLLDEAWSRLPNGRFEYRATRRDPIVWRGYLNPSGVIASVRRIDTAALRRLHVAYSRRLRARRRSR